jgi:hypothetical protein
MGDEEAPEEMEGDEPMEPMEPMGEGDADKEKELGDIISRLGKLVGVPLEVVGDNESSEELEEGVYGKEKKLEEEESLEEMDDAVLEETVRAILAK